MVNRHIQKSNVDKEKTMQKKEAFAKIMALKGVQPVRKIIDLLLAIDNFNQDTIDKLRFCHPYTGEVVPLDDIYVDLTYQRKLRLQALINRLTEADGFDKEVAGHIDLAIRSDGRLYVWDGFHRVIKAGLVKLDGMPASIFTHNQSLSIHEQVMKEAKMFKVRNADQTSMKPEEIFKSEVVFRDETALKILDVLKACNLDVEGTNEDAGAISLGGFVVFRKVWNKIDRRHFIDSAKIIRTAFPKDKTMSVILFCGLARLLEANNDDNSIKGLSFTELCDAFVEMVNSDVDIKQTYFTQPRLHGKPVESTSANILNYGLKNAYNDNGNEVKSLMKTLDIDEDELYADV